MAGRPRKPIAELEANGSAAEHPGRVRDRVNEPRPTTLLGSPPACFVIKDSIYSDRMVAIWEELAGQVHPGVVTGCDRWVFEDACRIRYTIRFGDAKPSHYSQMKAFLSELGMTPAGRTRVAAKKAEAADKRTPEGWATLAEERFTGGTLH